MGKLAEVGPSEAIFEEPLHPYTQALLSAVPLPEVGLERTQITLEGTVPSPADPPPGCRFHTRCPYAKEVCGAEPPALGKLASHEDHFVACHFAGELKLAGFSAGSA